LEQLCALVQEKAAMPSSLDQILVKDLIMRCNITESSLVLERYQDTFNIMYAFLRKSRDHLMDLVTLKEE
jgi:hypothetical protein